MSRAFIREAEPTEPRCPGCDAPGEQVGPATLKAHLPLADSAALGERAFYCVASGCRTAYFNGWGVSVPADRMTATAYPKDPAGPLCPCFGVTVEEVLADARAGHKERVKDLMERSRGPEARCVERCPDGQPCLPRVLRLFRESFQTP